MQPDQIYYLCLALVVLPLLPFSRLAVVVGLVWVIGHLGFEWFQIIAGLQGVERLYLTGLAGSVEVQPLFEMVVAIVGTGAVFGVAKDDYGQSIAILYIGTALVSAATALGNIEPWSAWWMDWTLAMLRVAVVPFTADWEQIGRALKLTDAYLQRMVTRGRKLDQW